VQGVEDKFDTFWEMSGLGETAEDDIASRTQTIRPPTILLESDRRRYLPKLPKLVSQHQRDTLPELEIHSVLGEGGMGLVRLATQVPLGRDVAVKTLKKGSRTDEEALVVLLREGWVTGILEHPNIVPIYQLGRDEDGDPMIVMKRVEGVAWLDLIRDPDPTRPEFDGHDPLDWHLDVLSQVCNAIHFAHSRGIIHRDLKPENVMIGAFGEVYVLDWGMALALEPDDNGRIPSVDDVTGPGGSPGYMAPEMVTPNERPLSARTDVYLLGATLHEIVMGEPPHKGVTLRQIMLAAYQSEPKEYPPHVPRQLADICNRSMARDPANRFASADAFRQAVGEYSRRKQSARLAKQAGERLDILYRYTAEETGESDDDPAVYDAFGQARFGFEQALEVDPDNDVARRGLEDALTLMAERELDRGAYRAASLLIADLREPRPDLDERLDALRAD
jgi:serine/threonine-protein kinase